MKTNYYDDSSVPLDSVQFTLLSEEGISFFYVKKNWDLLLPLTNESFRFYQTKARTYMGNLKQFSLHMGLVYMPSILSFLLSITNWYITV